MDNEIELDPSKEITSISFDFDGAHMALCHRTQGFSANNKPMPMLIKADEIDLDGVREHVEQVKQGNKEVQIESEEVKFLSDTKKLQAFLKDNQALLDSFSEGNSEESKTETNKASQPSEETKTNQGDLMADKKTDQEKLDKAKADFEARIATLEKDAAESQAENKVLTSKVDDFEKANQTRLEKAFISKVTTYSFITEDEREAFAKTLLEVDSEAVIVALDKAQAAIVALGKPQGVDGGVLNFSKTSTSNRVKDMIMKEHGLTDVSK